MSVAHWILVVGMLLGTSLPVSAAEAEQRKLSLGSQRVLTLPPEVRGYSVRDEGMLELRLIGRQHLLVIGLRRGRTELLLFGPQGPIRRIQYHVDRFELCELVICEACRLLPKGHLLQLGGQGDQPMLRGIAHSIEEARAVKHLAWVYPQFVVDVRLSERAVREGLLRVNHELWRAGFLGARAIVVGNQVGLSGHFASEREEANARAAIASSVHWFEAGLELPLAASGALED
ncbi:MAG TPA: pilus assembly protein N-terminal domain-containing protein [Archangium sp.]|jgi:hypothetical protein|uniref:pilus assembly protein N-terminal domain-containing protein n=1 Tax=Archangium sp. TaxID=1872627 RepID=UPI002ED825ED